MIGRRKEQFILEQCVQSKQAEFLVVYGRRRIGKTYLIKEYFNQSFAFYATGLSKAKTREQLQVFQGSLLEYGYTGCKAAPKDWFEAFGRLKEVLLSDKVRSDYVTGKKVVFLDELPWMDTARSNFKSALEYFWNSFASAQKDILLIVCGSATSWIIDNLLGDRGGFYNRITRQIHLQPFTLRECEELLSVNGIQMTRKQIIEGYMIFGGVPYYWNCLDKRLSLAQNVDELLFQESGQLYLEYDRLMRSLFKNYERHIAIIEAIAKTKGGLQRTQLAQISAIGDGQPLTKALMELEQCGFIRRYQNYSKEKNGSYFQLVDPFMRFCLGFLKNRKHQSWMAYLNSPSYYAWCGNAFEIVCLSHVPQMKEALGIRGVETAEYAWRSRNASSGAQIDLLIERKDGVINVCEMKYTLDPFEIDASYADNLMHKLEAFRTEESCKKAIHLTIVSATGVKQNKYAGMIQNSLAEENLFML